MRKMKDSGVAWIGEMPEEWETLPLARVIKERVSGNWGSEPTSATDNIICIRVADFDFSKFSLLDKSEYTQRGYKKNETLSMLTYGDILFEKSGGGQTTPVGRAIFFDKNMEATHSNFIDKLRVHDNYSNKFIFYYILISYLTTYSNMYIKQTTGIQNFDLTNFLAKERICLPPLPEQHRIASYLDAKCAEIDRSME
ncbi:restriction endonuclease subunit S, partial [Desulfovibrio sp.]|uniref:restriction endonuclease subunit S n=1 Tax=Desulfovibrio sp. TaxID=885 RepID=UPI0023CA940A